MSLFFKDLFHAFLLKIMSNFKEIKQSTTKKSNKYFFSETIKKKFLLKRRLKNIEPTLLPYMEFILTKIFGHPVTKKSR